MKRGIENEPNFGPVTADWLEAIGVRTLEDARRVGSVEIYRLLKERGFNISLNLVYGLEAAFLGIDWRQLPPEAKAELKAAVRNL